jgi:SPP1 gp7 family putative phage head morphogenesis protein
LAALPSRAKLAEIIAGWNPRVAKAIEKTPPDVRAAARAYLADAMPLDTDQMDSTVTDLATDAYLGGVVSATRAVNGALPQSMAGTNWDTWTPGWGGAAAQISDSGLSAVLANVGMTIKGIADSTIDQMGTQIADGLASGASMDSIARGLRDSVGGDADRAFTIADTEAARAVGVATLDTYTANGVTGKVWLGDDSSCEEICQPNIDAGVIAVDDTFPSGDDAPPGHPRCRCSLASASLADDSTSGDTTEEG